jgi:hypothetical protein
VSKESENSLQLRVDELKLRIRELNDPKGDAFRCGMDYKMSSEGPILSFSMFNVSTEIIYPELIARDVRNGKILNTAYQALICYYLETSSSSPHSHQEKNNWISFADLPDGRFYNQAFQGYTGNKLAVVIESDISKFSNIAKKLDGLILDIGDMAYQFLTLPKVPVAVVFWRGDEEFSSNCKILFNQTVSNHLPTDACAIIGSMLTQAILKHFNN